MIPWEQIIHWGRKASALDALARVEAFQPAAVELKGFLEQEIAHVLSHNQQLDRPPVFVVVAGGHSKTFRLCKAEGDIDPAAWDKLLAWGPAGALRDMAINDLQGWLEAKPGPGDSASFGLNQETVVLVAVPDRGQDS